VNPPAPCALPHHEPDSRVAFHQWDNQLGQMRHYTGTVLAHADRRIKISTDAPYRTVVETECGHVAKAGAR
jgi:hypothetical protein